VREIQEQLIILQPTPFCNIDCKYCYLPYRSSTKRMSKEVLESIYREVFKTKRFNDPITFVWHAGEPLSVPPAFYRDAFDLALEINKPFNRTFSQNIQTNATLINDEWIELFRQYNVGVGVSLDGPAFIHDQQRVTRTGQGTHDKVMGGIKLLQTAGIPFSVIMVLTGFALDYPDEVFNFFVDNNMPTVGFNIDELEGSNHISSYGDVNALEKYKHFMRRFIELTDKSHGKLRVREFSATLPAILRAGNSERPVINSTNVAYQLMTFDSDGNYSTFCPELCGTKSEKYSNFVMGNILLDKIDDMIINPVFKLVNEEVQAGVKACQDSCPYWNFCGGGAPGNKFFEHGHFNVTETLACRVHKKALVDVLIEHLESKVVPLSEID
jgi:uncharacterized protein